MRMDHFEAKYIDMYIEFTETKCAIIDHRNKANLFIAKKLHPNVHDEWIEHLQDMNPEDVDKKLILMEAMDSSQVTEEEFWKIEVENQRARKVEQQTRELKVNIIISETYFFVLKNILERHNASCVIKRCRKYTF